MDDERQDMPQQTEQPDEQSDDCRQLNSVERFYERFRNVPLKYLDRFILICVAALILVLVLGFLDSRS